MSKFVRLGKKAPEGWDIVLDTLEMFENRMKDAVNESHEGKRKHETKWPIHRINYERTRYVYEMHYTKKEISRELLDFCIREKVVDGNLMAKWKKPGYERDGVHQMRLVRQGRSDLVEQHTGREVQRRGQTRRRRGGG
jgi:bud site selection protein 31